MGGLVVRCLRDVGLVAALEQLVGDAFRLSQHLLLEELMVVACLQPLNLLFNSEASNRIFFNVHIDVCRIVRILWQVALDRHHDFANVAAGGPRKFFQMITKLLQVRVQVV